jgi:hypothetical protein
LINAGQPWLAPLQPMLAPALAAWQGGASVAEALNRARDAFAVADAGVPRFVPQADLPAGEPYEAFIHRCARVPTRDNLHDFFNGLVWLRWPPLKRRLNQWHDDDLARHGVTGRRGPLRDALTLFDESGALLQAPELLGNALRRRDWTALFITHRSLWQQAQLTLIGHALLEKLAVAPRKPLTAQVLLVDPLVLAASDWATKPFCPLPVLGVPGWWPGNETPGFYDDPAVFRPAGSPRSTDTARRCRS